MSKKRNNQQGFSGLESVMVVLIVAIIGAVGWYVYHSSQKSNDALNTASNNSLSAAPHNPVKSASIPAATTGNDNASLQTDLTGVAAASNNSDQALGNSNSSLNDQSTLTSVPQ